MAIEPQRLQAFLEDVGLVKKEDFEEALREAEKRKISVEKVLIEKKLITPQELTNLKAYILGTPFINLEGQNIPREVLEVIPEPMAKTHRAVAFRETEEAIEIAMEDPEDLPLIEFIKKKTGKKVLPRLTNKESIDYALKLYQQPLEAEFKQILPSYSEESEVLTSPIETKEEDKTSLKKAAQELPIIKIVDTILKHAILSEASDIHIEPEEKDVKVRFRIDGILKEVMTLPKQVAPGLVARIKVLSNLKLDEHRLPQDGRFKIETKEYKYAARVSIMPVVDGEKVVIRLLPERAKAFTLEELGLRGISLKRVKENLKKPIGMILVTGPTGSGKTTTLYTMLQILNKPEVNIATAEDPVEYRMPGINQTQVNPQIGLTFANCLRALMRQDPDIIMVGEIRDKETAELAVNAALTGHLVLSTLHTNQSAGAIPRLIEMGVEPFLLASTLNLIIAQRLIRKLCPEKESYKLNKEELNLLKEEYRVDQLLERVKKDKEKAGFALEKVPSLEEIELFKPKVSKKCPDGYKGRIGIFEVLEVSESIKELIIKKSPAIEIEKAAKKEGMFTMLEDGLLKALEGITSLEEVLRVISE